MNPRLKRAINKTLVDDPKAWLVALSNKIKAGDAFIMHFLRLFGVIVIVVGWFIAAVIAHWDFTTFILISGINVVAWIFGLKIYQEYLKDAE